MRPTKPLWALTIPLPFAAGLGTNTSRAQNPPPGPTPWQDPFHCSPVVAGNPPKTDGSAAQPATSPQPDIFDELAACGLSLQNNINDNTQGGAFTQADTNGTSGFKSQFALIYTSQPFYQSGIRDTFNNITSGNYSYLIGDVDANLNSSSASAERTSYLNARMEVGNYLQESTWDYSNPNYLPLGLMTSTTGLFWRAGPVFQTTQDSAVQNGLFEVAALPLAYGPANGLPVVLGQYAYLFGTQLQYRLQPYFTLQTGREIAGLDLSREFDHTRLRLITEPILEFQVTNPEKVLGFGLSGISLTLDDAFTVNPLEGKTIVIKKVSEISPNTHNLLTVSLNLSIGKLSFSPSYSIGQTAPLYKQSHTVTVGLKLQFGSGTLHVPGAP